MARSKSQISTEPSRGEKVIASLDNQTATMGLGQFSVESKFIKVYLT